jgi:hypothetical protein
MRVRVVLRNDRGPVYRASQLKQQDSPDVVDPLLRVEDAGSLK